MAERDFGAFIEELHERGLYDLAREIASKHHVTMFELLNSNTPHVMIAKGELVQYLRSKKWSFHAIGRMLGGRDHTTIMYNANGKRRSGKPQGRPPGPPMTDEERRLAKKVQREMQRGKKP